MEFPALGRTLTELDHLRLTNLVFLLHGDEGNRPSSSPSLPIEHVLEAADIVQWRRIPRDVVTMQSRVLLEDAQTAARSTLTVCYPAGADPGAGFVSVLSPAGSSLLGQRVGSTARWLTPTGRERAVEILGILFQPEWSGARAAATRCGPQHATFNGETHENRL